MIKHPYKVDQNNICIEMEDGSMFYVHVSDKGGTISWAPDQWTYPEQLDAQGRKHSGPYTIHTPVADRT